MQFQSILIVALASLATVTTATPLLELESTCGPINGPCNANGCEGVNYTCTAVRLLRLRYKQYLPNYREHTLVAHVVTIVVLLLENAKTMVVLGRMDVARKLTRAVLAISSAFGPRSDSESRR